MNERKTVLVVDDDPGILHVMADGLSNVLGLFDVVTASNGREAIETLESRTVDVLVTDLVMPIVDGFSLIAYVTNRRTALPVVVMSGMVQSMLDRRLAGYGGLRVLRKPVSYQDVATCVFEELERVNRGQVEGIPLAGVVQLIEAERRSCKIVVRSGKRRGTLLFESGRLLNAFSDDFGAEGEAAAYDILSWPDTSIEFEPLPTSVRRLIHTPMQLMLVELAVSQDRTRESADADPPLGDPPPSDEPAGSPPNEPAMGWTDEATEEPTMGPTGEPTAPPTDEPTDGPTDEPVTSPTDEPVTSPADEPTDGPTDDMAAGPLASGDPDALGDGVFDGAWTPAAASLPRLVDDTILLDEPAPPADEVAAPELATGVSGPPQVGARHEAAAAVQVPADRVAAADGAGGPDAHLHEMVAAIERLAQRAKAADEALAAVASEVEAFREARRRFDEADALRERRRRDLERFRDEVALLAREILGRVDGVFDAMTGDPVTEVSRENRPAT